MARKTTTSSPAVATAPAATTRSTKKAAAAAGSPEKDLGAVSKTKAPGGVTKKRGAAAAAARTKKTKAAPAQAAPARRRRMVIEDDDDDDASDVEMEVEPASGSSLGSPATSQSSLAAEASAAPAPKKAATATSPSSSSTPALYLTEYTPASVALYGETIELRDEIKRMGGRFNKALLIDGKRMPGWVMPASRRASAAKWIAAKTGAECVVRRRRELDALEAEAAKADGDADEKAEVPQAMSAAEASELMVIPYTAKSVALLGAPRAFSTVLSKMGGRFNARLKPPAGSAPGVHVVTGWVFPSGREADVEAWIAAELARAGQDDDDE
ncbi:hypothetical protein HK405_003129 [Cladochytrium tenue]|nr:hypothetical protein HK405_003129 [Cladochytrium tenue]